MERRRQAPRHADSLRPAADRAGPRPGPILARRNRAGCGGPISGRQAGRAHFAGSAGFSAASQFVRPEDVAESIACGPDLDAIAESVRPYLEAGFTDIAIVQVGDEQQQRFLDEAAEPLLEKLRAL